LEVLLCEGEEGKGRFWMFGGGGSGWWTVLVGVFKEEEREKN
jgi:hypothetical protein